MTSSAPAETVSAPRAKEPIPPLDARAPRPPVVRLRKSVVTAAVMSAAGLLAASLAWAFVVEPQQRAHAHDRVSHPPQDARGAVRPSALVTDRPATYSQLDALPEPRRLSGGPQTAATPAHEGPPAPPSAPPPKTAPRGPTAVAQARQSGLFFQTGSVGAKPGADGGSGAGSAGGKDYGEVYNPHGLIAPLSPYELKAGSIVPAALLTGIDTARAGPVVATVTQDIFDTVSGRILIIPQGARLIGRHEGESRHGDKRAFLEWQRLILPNGKSLVLAREPGVDPQGTIGVEGQVDRRLGPLAVATLFAGAITTLGQVARDHQDHTGGLLGDAGDATAIEGAQVGGKLIDRELDVRPSIRLTPGARVQVLITHDLILEPYRP